MARGRVAYRKRRQNRFSMFMAVLVVVLIMVAVAWRSIELKQKIEEYSVKEAQLSAEIESEKERSTEIEEYGIYTQTKAFFEEVAKDKLGLVYEGEILFKQE
ncbi:MAG: septum formation initiator family protein [Lachnospiraceae bacterium]|nr:septum formation initiator family protein [Lachnospiraceae bacterium]